ncbi:MAG: DNA primase [Muribaculaceae bacterium]|nr:DNA primase [Muribaculaceae bacterium]
MKRIDSETTRQILDAANIVDVVSDFVSLKRRGANYIGLCPFHNERTPSFSVSPARGICKCFSCGKGGSPVNFIMEHEQMSYNEALRYLAKKYHIEIHEREVSDEERRQESERESMWAVNDFALRHFEDNLVSNPDGRAIGLAYFRERGIDDAMIARFHLGYSLERSSALYDAARAKGFDERFLVETGLCIRTDQGRVYDRFKGRVIYPVHSISGKVVAFGGRTLRSDKQVAKYVNSPESPIYHKSSQLYGLYQAKRAIVAKGKCILVEGYMDVISMHQAGVENVVASSGTSLTEGQIRLIHRFTENVTVIYDSDAAGIKASLRGIDMLLAEGLNIKVLLLPDGDDPDSFAQHHSSTEVEEYLAANETDFIRFKTRILLEDAADDPIRRADVINDILRSISLIPDLVKRQVYIAECSRSLGIKEEALGLQLARIATRKAEDDEKRAARRTAEESIAGSESPDSTSAQPADSGTQDYGAGFLRDYECRVLRYVVKYALCEFCDVEDAEGNLVPMTVLDYVRAEMRRDGMEFSCPLHARIMSMVEDTAATWPQVRPEIEARLAGERRQRLDAAYADLRSQQLGVSAINAREAQIVAEADGLYREALDNAALDYVGRTLCSAPDDDVRRLCTDLSVERYRLSKIHTKHTKVESERDSLIRLVPRVISELKGAILEVMIHRLQTRLKQSDGQGADDLALLREMKRLMAKRADFARDLGERTITPRRI